MPDKKIQEIRERDGQAGKWLESIRHDEHPAFCQEAIFDRHALLKELDSKDTIIAEAYKQLANWTLDCVDINDELRVITNECIECRKIIDGWDKGHKEGCEVGALMGKLSKLLEKASQEAKR